jgi:hypothetical protein
LIDDPFGKAKGSGPFCRPFQPDTLLISTIQAHRLQSASDSWDRTRCADGCLPFDTRNIASLAREDVSDLEGGPMRTRKESLICLFAVAWLGLCPPLRAEVHMFSQQVGSQPVTDPMPKGSLLASLQRSGGYAGIHDTFYIYQDGTVADDKGTTRQLQAAVLKSIREKITALDLPTSCRIILPAWLCSDCFHYRITLVDSSGTKVLSMNELQMSGSDSVSELARDLRDIVLNMKWK